MSGRLGVLLMTYGSPAADLHDLPQYLVAVRGGREPSSELVEEFRRRYELIGGSPLIPITRAQAAAVAERLHADGHDAAATVGMRFSAPTVLDGLRELSELGCETVSAIVMSPQYSGLLMDGYRNAARGRRRRAGREGTTRAAGARLAPRAGVYRRRRRARSRWPGVAARWRAGPPHRALASAPRRRCRARLPRPVA